MRLQKRVSNTSMNTTIALCSGLCLLLTFTLCSQCYAIGASSMNDEVAWKEWAKDSFICTGVVGDTVEEIPPVPLFNVDWTVHHVRLDGVLQGDLPDEILVRFPVREGINIVLGARCLLQMIPNDDGSNDLPDYPAYRIWYSPPLLAAKKPAGGAEGEKPWIHLAREAAAAIASGDAFIAYDGMQLALFLRHLTPELTAALKPWAAGEDWPLGLLARGILMAYGDEEMRHAVLDRLVKERGIPSHEFAYDAWPYDTSNPSNYLSINMSGLVHSILDSPPYGAPLLDNSDTLQLPVDLSSAPPIPTDWTIMKEEEPEIPITRDEKAEKLLVSILMDNAFEQQMRTAAFSVLTFHDPISPQVVPCLPALLWRDDTSDWMMKQVMIHLWKLRESEGAPLPGKEYYPKDVPDNEFNARMPEFVEAWRRVTPKPVG